MMMMIDMNLVWMNDPNANIVFQLNALKMRRCSIDDDASTKQFITIA
jgi:hypothetical protein